MSNTMLNFKYGEYKNLPTSKIPGTVYVTTDEQAMYVDLPKANSTELARVRIGDIIVKNSVRDAEPPFCEDAFYYFITENALLRWGVQEDGKTKGWKQINSVSDVTTDLSNVKSQIADIEKAIDQLDLDLKGEIKRSTDEDADHEARITAIENDYVTQSSVNKAVDEINTEIGKTNAAVATAQGKADEAYTLADQAKSDAANAQSAAEAAQGTANGAQSAANAAQSAADAAQSAAEAAQGTADEAQDAASDAQSRADEAYTLADQAKSDAGTAQGTADNALAAANSAQEAANNAQSAADAAQGTADNALAAAGNAQSAAGNAQSRADEAYTLADQAKSDAGTAKSAADAAQGTADNALAAANAKLPLTGGTLQGNLDMNDSFQITNLKDPADKKDAATKKYVDDIASSLQTEIDETEAKALLVNGTNKMTADLDMGSTEADGNKIINLADPTLAQDAATKNYVDSEIVNKIKLIDAMTYKGVVSQSSTATYTTEPHTATAQKGDVWKVGAPGVYAWNGTTGITAKAGDLLIYNGNDDSNLIGAWEHVSSGYEDDYLQKFMVQSISQGVALHLSDGLGDDIPDNFSASKIHFVTPETSGLKIESVTGQNQTIPTIKVSFAWQSFDPVEEPES